MKTKTKRLWNIVKKAFVVGAVLLSVCGTAQTSHAEEGTWKQDEKGWWYELSDGSYARQTWMLDGAAWYAFDEAGYMITGWCRLDGTWYYFQPDGIMTTGWVKEGNIWYLMDETGKMQTGWTKLADRWYYLYPNGAMAADDWVDGCYLDTTGVWIEGKAPQTDLSAKITAAIDRMRIKYPDGSYWNHMGSEGEADYSNAVTSIPCDHVANGLTYCNSYILGNVRGYQCDGFARKMSDEVFGTTAGRTDYAYAYDKIKPGDYLRFSNSRDSFISNGHSVFVITKTADKLVVVEANYGGKCMIHWDAELTREYLDSVYAECFTRY